MTKTAPLAPKPKRPKQVPLTFSKTEEYLLTLLDQTLKSTPKNYSHSIVPGGLLVIS